MSDTPSVRQLTYFIAVADTLSFVKAAERCHVTQPTLSGGLNTLEAMLGEKLFERTKRAVTLTAIGEELVLPARDIVLRAEDFVLMARMKKEPFTGTLRIGVIPTIAPYLLPTLLPALQTKFPALDLQLKEDVTARLLSALNQRLIDVVLMAFPYDTPGITQKKLWAEPFVIAMPGNKPKVDGLASLNDLSRHNIMLLEDGHCLRDHALAACHLQPTTQRQTFGATSLATLIQMVQHGYGATLLPAMAVTKNLPTGVTIQRFFSPEPTRQIGLAWRQGNPQEKEFHLLGDFIVKMHKAG